MFRLHVEAFPDSWKAYDSLGEAYGRAGDRPTAREKYMRSVALGPDSQRGLEALRKLGGGATTK